jgi:hypothetical protein
MKFELNDKFQNPCLRRSGFAQAGKFQVNVKLQNELFLAFELWILFEI